MISGRQLPLTPRPKPGLANSPRMINDVAGNDWPGLVIFKLWIISTDSLPPSLPPLLSPGQSRAEDRACAGSEFTTNPITLVLPGWNRLAAPLQSSRLRHQAGRLEMGSTRWCRGQ